MARYERAAMGEFYTVLRGMIVAVVIAIALPLVAQDHDTCLDCHNDPEFTGEDRNGSEISLHVDPDMFAASVHAENDCMDCHDDIDDPEDHPERLAPVRCEECHDDVQETLKASVHGNGDKATQDKPTCVQCHGKHHILSKDDPDSLVSKTKQAELCLSCHANPDVIKRNRFMADQKGLYEHGIHGQLTASGNLKAAICSDCHSGHGMRRAIDPAAKIHKLNVAKTCQPCHEEAYDAYAHGVHGQSLAGGVKDSPTCIDCHGEHDIIEAQSELARTSGSRMAVEVCNPCHESERLSKKYGLALGRASSYRNSYHGLASKGGVTQVANCGSCHGYHDILPSDDPQSSIHVDNLAQTCGDCHKNAGANFTKGRIHLVGEGGIVSAVAWVRRLYLVLIAVVIGLMVLHNGLDFWAEVRRKGMSS